MPPVHSKEWKTLFIQCSGRVRQGRTSPCEHACPAGNLIQKMHTLIEHGDADEALRWLHARNPFPGITGRTCPHPCESECNRAKHDEATAIHCLERFTADHGRRAVFTPLPSSGKTIAVIGAGPAGLAAAHYAALLGHAVEVYECSPVMGGIPRQAIPDFRLPKDVADREIAAAIEGSVMVRTNIRVGRDIMLRDIVSRHDAVLLSIGLWKERILDLPGKEYLQPAVHWLKKTTLERKSLEGQDVAIVGGGGVAFDCAFTARRLKARSVHILCVESEACLRAPAEEVGQARREGIELHPSLLSRRIEEADGRFRIVSDRVTAFSFDAAGKLQAETDGSQQELAADCLICASGLMLDEGALRGVELARSPRGFIQVDGMFQTSHPGLFAAGDAASGPGLVAAAIASGRKAAVAMHSFLNGTDAPMDIWVDQEGQVRAESAKEQRGQHVVAFEEIMNISYHEHAPRACPVELKPIPGVAFQEIAGGLEEDDARKEAGRCLHCGHCMECGSCVESCPGHILEMTDDGPRVAYPRQCWHCGCCRIACPTGSIAYVFPLNMMV